MRYDVFFTSFKGARVECASLANKEERGRLRRPVALGDRRLST